MGEKVILTQKQGIELAAMKYGGISLEDWVNRKNNPAEPYSCIDALTLDEMARALYANDYEVERPEFQAGDFIFNERTKVLVQLTEQSATLTNDGYWDVQNVRHATPEEVYWLHELKRKKVPDFKIGDVFVDRLNAGYRLNEEQNVKDFTQYYEEDDFRGIYPVGSFKPFNRKEE